MDPFAVLGIDPQATEAEIVRAFRRLVLVHHPDRNGGSAEAAARFREIKQAYDAVRGRARPKPTPPAAAQRPASTDARTRLNFRTLDPDRVERVRARLPRLHEAIRAAIAAPDRETLAALIDVARWTRLDVDNALALKGHVAELRDAHWAQRRFVDPSRARATFAEFVEAKVDVLDLVEMRNLRARVDGLLATARGYEAAL